LTEHGVSHSGSAARSERSFGLTVGGAFLLIGAVAFWRNRMWLAQVTGGLGALLVFFGLVAPSLLRLPNRLWWKIAFVLGWVNSRILLGGLFFLLLAPIGVWWRIRGKDPLTRRRDRWPGWSPRPARFRDPQHFKKMY
jgi:hypothetical protein